MTDLLLGLGTGAAFGFLLQRARVIRYDLQVGALLLQDMTIVKFMLSSILVSMPLLFALDRAGLDVLAAPPTLLGANLIGGLLFGAGWGLLGYCPGTQAGALGEGRWDALWGILGMIFGAAVYGRLYPALKGSVLAWGDLGPLTLPGLTGVDGLLLSVPLAVAGILLFRWLEKRGL